MQEAKCAGKRGKAGRRWNIKTHFGFSAEALRGFPAALGCNKGMEENELLTVLDCLMSLSAEELRSLAVRLEAELPEKDAGKALAAGLLQPYVLQLPRVRRCLGMPMLEQLIEALPKARAGEDGLAARAADFGTALLKALRLLGWARRCRGAWRLPPEIRRLAEVGPEEWQALEAQHALYVRQLCLLRHYGLMTPEQLREGSDRQLRWALKGIRDGARPAMSKENAQLLLEQALPAEALLCWRIGLSAFALVGDEQQRVAVCEDVRIPELLWRETQRAECANLPWVEPHQGAFGQLQRFHACGQAVSYMQLICDKQAGSLEQSRALFARAVDLMQQGDRAGALACVQQVYGDAPYDGIELLTDGMLSSIPLWRNKGRGEREMLRLRMGSARPLDLCPCGSGKRLRDCHGRAN